MAKNIEELDSWEALRQEAQEARITVEALYEEAMRRSSAPPEPLAAPLTPRGGNAAPATPAAAPA